MRRITAWFTIVALLAGLALPAHAHARHQQNGAPGGDFCTTSDARKSTPDRPAENHASTCDACCGCAAGSAPPMSIVRVGIALEQARAIIGFADVAHATSQVRFSFARGPPRA